MTRKKILDILDRNHDKATYDTALPQDYVNEVYEKTGFYLPGEAVWLYDNGGFVFGRPFPLSVQARKAIADFDSGMVGAV